MSWAIASDLSGTVETTDGFGKFETELEAADRLILYLEGERGRIADKLAAAKRRRRVLLRRHDVVADRNG